MKEKVSAGCPMKLVCNCLHDRQCIGQKAVKTNNDYIPFSHFIAHVESQTKAAVVETWLAAVAGVTLCLTMIGFVAALPV